MRGKGLLDNETESTVDLDGPGTVSPQTYAPALMHAEASNGDAVRGFPPLSKVPAPVPHTNPGIMQVGQASARASSPSCAPDPSPHMDQPLGFVRKADQKVEETPVPVAPPVIMAPVQQLQPTQSLGYETVPSFTTACAVWNPCHVW